MKYLVTGGNGYLGRGVIQELINRGDTVIATDIKFREKKLENVVYLEKDIFKCENLYQEFGQPDVLIHLAWRDGFRHNSPAHMEDLSQHYKFITEMYESGIRHIVVLGSMHEVGYHEGALDENTPTKPLSLYGVAKNALRESLQIYFKDKDVVFQWIRGFYIVKNTEEGCSIFSKIVQEEHKGTATFPFTTGKNKYDFMDYSEFCEKLVMIARQEKYKGCINCCSGVPMSLSERVESFIRENHFNIKLNYGVFPDREYDSPAIWGDNTIIKLIGEENVEENC